MYILLELIHAHRLFSPLQLIVQKNATHMPTSEAELNKDHKAIQGLMRKYQSVVAPDRKAIYEDSMKQTGGKMNAACMFWDNSGNKSLAWHPIMRRWYVFPTEEEQDRTRAFYSIYNDELKRLQSEYGDEARGRISLRQIHDDLDTVSASSGTGSQLNVRG